MMDKILLAFCFLSFLSGCSSVKKPVNLPTEITISKETLEDKIKGGWAGQTIGCTYGGPTEFRFNGTMIQDYVPIEWDSNKIKWWYDNAPGLYDDVYMDISFVSIFEKYGLNAPLDSFANSFAHAGFGLWHANQAARYNILNGIKAPASGHWQNNPHANDIDFQIEADFAGLMSPGMPNAATKISDSIGHIMNYGDGWYGGVYVASMYSLAFVSSDITWVVTEALKSIPAESDFYKCISDVIKWHKQYPDDWKSTWFEVEKKWSSELYCPYGVFVPTNIDASINSAYVVIGLLYGNGDFTRTIDIATRCGQDSDCNPATAAGVLGTVLGYSKIPQVYMDALKIVEDRDLLHTDASLADTYRMSFKHALQMIELNGGNVDGNQVRIIRQDPVPARYEVAFNNLYPIGHRSIYKPVTKVGKFNFDGKGVVFKGYVKGPEEYVAEIEMYIDGKLIERAKLPVAFRTRRHEIHFWNYSLESKPHEVEFKWLNPKDDVVVQFDDVLIYGDRPKSN